MVFYKNMKKQNWLLPPNIEDMIDDEHLCYIVDIVVDSMDFSKQEKEADGPGHPGYHPRILIKIHIMGLIDGIRHSRKLHKCVRENVVYIYLAEKYTPDFRTISDFRKNNPELIESCFKSVVDFAKDLGMVRLGHISIDGTKIKANASKNKSLKKDELKFLDKIIKTEIQKGIEADELDDEIYGEDKDGYELPDDIKMNENIRKYLKKKLDEEGINSKNQRTMGKIIKEHIKVDEKRKKQISKNIEDTLDEIENSDVKTGNLTDPDSNLMKNKKGVFEQCYSPQIAVDSEYKIIIANNVSHAPDDRDELIPMIEEVEKNVGKLSEDTEVSADNGYFSGPNLKYLEDKELNGFIPNSKQAQRMKGKTVTNDPFGKECFEYDEKNDVFICPNKEILIFRHEYYNKDIKKKTRVYYTENCGDCPYKQQCLKESSKPYRRIKADDFEGFKRRMAKKMKSEKAKEKLKLRMKIVEHPFGDIKYNMGLIEFLTRGDEKVSIEFNLACVAHNIKRIMSFIKERYGNIKNYLLSKGLFCKKYHYPMG
jgi:transposase